MKKTTIKILITASIFLTLFIATTFVQAQTNTFQHGRGGYGNYGSGYYQANTTQYYYSNDRPVTFQQPYPQTYYHPSSYMYPNRYIMVQYSYPPYGGYNGQGSHYYYNNGWIAY